MEEEVLSLAPGTPRNKNASYVAIGVIAAVIATLLFIVSQRMDSGAHHYDTAAAKQELVTAAPVSTTTVVAVNKFTAADAHFRAVFPATPKRSVESFTGPDGKRYSMTMYEHATGSGDFAIGSLPLASGTPFDLEAALDGTAYLMGARVGSRYQKKFQGNDAYEAVIAAGCGCDLVKAFMMLVRTNDRVTFIFGGADGDSEARYVAFRDSIEFI